MKKKREGLGIYEANGIVYSSVCFPLIGFTKTYARMLNDQISFCNNHIHRSASSLPYTEAWWSFQSQ